MDRTYRNEILKTVHPEVVNRCILADLKREYTLNEFVLLRERDH